MTTVDVDGARGDGAAQVAPPRAVPWRHAPVLGVCALSFTSGIAQFAVTAVAGDVADVFGQSRPGDDLASQLGLSATTLSLALALIRGASLGAMPATAIADRFGRRRVLLVTALVGLAATAVAAGAPSFWLWVALVALARPFLSTVNTVAGVVAAEEADGRWRSTAVAMIAASYGLGAGAVSIGRSFLPEDASFRPVMAVSALSLVALPLVARLLREPPVFEHVEVVDRERGWRRWLPGAVPRDLVRLTVLVSVLSGAVAIATGPGFTYLFVYGEQVLGASPSTMAAIVVAAGPVGGVGLLVGRWAADHVGRRLTSGVTMAATGVAVVVAYNGSLSWLVAGYLLAILVSSAFGPAFGALLAELFPTTVRSTAAAWAAAAGVLGAVAGLAGFGMLADVMGSFERAIPVVAAPVVLSALLFSRVPETRGTDALR